MAEMTKKADIEKNTRTPLYRIQLIHAYLSSNRYPNCKFLAKRLEVSEKTILRDIAFMQESLNMPIDYDAQKYGYFYNENLKSIGFQQWSESEIIALLVCVATINTLVEEPVLKIIMKKFLSEYTESYRCLLALKCDEISENIGAMQNKFDDLAKYLRAELKELGSIK